MSKRDDTNADSDSSSGTEADADSPAESDNSVELTDGTGASDGVEAENDGAADASEPTTEGTDAASVEASTPEKASDEVYCSSCGEAIKADAEICPHCGVRQRAASGGEEKNAALSFVASLVVPGAGQVYNGQLGRGIAGFLGACVVDTIIVLLAIILSVVLIGPFFLLLIPVVHVLIAYDAYTQAEKINRGEVTV